MTDCARKVVFGTKWCLREFDETHVWILNWWLFMEFLEFGTLSSQNSKTTWVECPVKGSFTWKKLASPDQPLVQQPDPWRQSVMKSKICSNLWLTIWGKLNLIESVDSLLCSQKIEDYCIYMWVSCGRFGFTPYSAFFDPKHLDSCFSWKSEVSQATTLQRIWIP